MEGVGRRLPGAGVVGAGAAGGAGVEGWRVSASGGGGAGGGRRSLFKRPRRHRARPALAVQTCGVGSRVRCGRAVGAGSGAAPSALGLHSRRSRPSRTASLPVPRSLSGALSRSLIFSPPPPPPPPRRRQVPASRPGAGCPARSLGARSALHRLARALGLTRRLRGGGSGGSTRSIGTVAGAPRSPSAGAAPNAPRGSARRLRLLGRQFLPAASGTLGSSVPGSVRSVSIARRGRGSGHRLPAPLGRSRPLAAASTSRRAVRKRGSKLFSFSLMLRYNKPGTHFPFHSQIQQSVVGLRIPTLLQPGTLAVVCGFGLCGPLNTIKVSRKRWGAVAWANPLAILGDSVAEAALLMCAQAVGPRDRQG